MDLGLGWMKKLEEPAYAAFRIVAGALYLPHGMQKLLGAFGGMPPNGASADFSKQPQIWIGGFLELTCGALVALGLFTRPAAFLASGTMAVAFWQFHFQADAPLPVQNGGELAVLYCFAFFAIAAKGPGMLALDGLFRRK